MASRTGQGGASLGCVEVTHVTYSIRMIWCFQVRRKMTKSQCFERGSKQWRSMSECEGDQSDGNWEENRRKYELEDIPGTGVGVHSPLCVMCGSTTRGVLG